MAVITNETLGVLTGIVLIMKFPVNVCQIVFCMCGPRRLRKIWQYANSVSWFATELYIQALIEVICGHLQTGMEMQCTVCTAIFSQKVMLVTQMSQRALRYSPRWCLSHECHSVHCDILSGDACHTNVTAVLMNVSTVKQNGCGIACILFFLDPSV
jgi:hypothetical protein